MCSIMGYCGSGATFDSFKKGFDRTVSRGPDDSRIIDTGKGLLGFHRLAIMGLTPSGMQPFELEGSYIVCNGELYGFEKQKATLKQKGYTFMSDSDCEILLPMYFEYGLDMFAMLDAEFAPSAEAFQEEAQKRIRELHMYDVLRADRCISVNSQEARVPFGDLDFVKYVMALDPEMKLNKYGKGKYLLRHAFEGGGYLPDDILWREKAAFSDAVGHSMVDYLKEYAEQQYSDEEFEAARRKYTHAAPFTKESLFYREIFEKYYPGQAEMVVDFWMPNKSWEGCNVNDPSARVLSNYGDSGK